MLVIFLECGIPSPRILYAYTYKVLTIIFSVFVTFRTSKFPEKTYDELFMTQLAIAYETTQGEKITRSAKEIFC